MLVIAFGPARGAGFSDNTLETLTTNLGIIVTSGGMLLSLAGTIGGTYYATGRGRQLGYLVALLGAVSQIVGFTWDNILHATGHTHFDEAHNAAVGGLIVLILASLFLGLNAKFAEGFATRFKRQS